MKRETLEKIIAEFNCTANDTHKRELKNVLLEKNEGRVRIMACDGFKLSITDSIDEELSLALVDKKWIVPKGSLPIMRLILKTCEKNSVIPIEKDDKEIIVGHSNLRFTIRIDELNSYPDYDAIWPKDESNYTAKVRINPNFLLNLLKSLNTSKRECSVMLSINTSDKHAPIIVEHENGKGLIATTR